MSRILQNCFRSSDHAPAEHVGLKQGAAIGRRSFIDAYVFPDGDLLSLPRMLGPAE